MKTQIANIHCSSNKPPIYCWNAFSTPCKLSVAPFCFSDAHMTGISLHWALMPTLREFVYCSRCRPSLIHNLTVIAENLTHTPRKREEELVPCKSLATLLSFQVFRHFAFSCSPSFSLFYLCCSNSSNFIRSLQCQNFLSFLNYELGFIFWNGIECFYIFWPQIAAMVI